jgi:hypothetical protein
LHTFCSKRDTISDYEIKRAHFGWAEARRETDAMEGALSIERVAVNNKSYISIKEPVVASGRELRIKLFRGQNQGGKRRPPCRPIESPLATQEEGKRRNGEEHEKKATGPCCWSH